MSTSSDSSSRPTQHNPQEERRRWPSKYDIYGTATKPFGASYRRRSQESSAEEPMGCSTSRTGVAQHESSVKGSFNAEEKTATTTSAEPQINPNRNVDSKEVHNVISNKLSDFEIIYGVDEKPKNHENNAYCTDDTYSEVKKPEKSPSENDGNCKLDAREKLMLQIRERKEETFEIERNSTPDEAEGRADENSSTERNKSEKEENSEVRRKSSDNQVSAATSNDPVSFVEEEFSYEPGKQEPTSKLVVRSRSLAALEQNQITTQKRPNALKITTKPDGSIRYGLRQEVSDSDLLDSDESPSLDNETKNNYVSSIKSAFESQNQDKEERAEAFDGLRQYFHENKHGLQELLINNNVVIIEPFRHEPPSSPTDTTSQRTCRITGATIKSPTSEQNKPLTHSNTLPRRNTKSQQNRQGFYHPIKVNKEIIDTELPDPEKVKSAREWFEKIFKSKPSSEIPSNKCTKSFFNTITSKMRITPEVKVVQEGRQPRRQVRSMTDQTMRYSPHRRWTDSGSLSSGVSSDFSCDQDYHDGSSNPDILEEYSTEDEDTEYFYPYDDNERHPVSSEVLQKIRACGTTVTYYGGKVISRSHGQFRSPMTMSIMDEIRQGGGATESRKKFESDSEEPYLGVKFRLVKSNSCGSRLEIAGTEDDGNPKLPSPRHESIAEEAVEEEENQTSLEEEEYKTEADRYDAKPAVMTWADLKLKEARKQWHCAPEAVRVPAQDMEFETFEVLDDSKPRKIENNEAGRG